MRFLGTFLTEPTDVPVIVSRYLASQLGITDISCLERYRTSESRWDHTAEIRNSYGYRDFNSQPEHWRLVRWLYSRAWLSAERPSILFDLATARLVERKILLPGATGLERLVARVRDRAANRLWRVLAQKTTPSLQRRLEDLLVTTSENRLTPLERLRRSPTRQSARALVAALNRLVEIRSTGIGQLDLSIVPPNRLLALARYASTAWAGTLRRLSQPRRVATLLAFIQVLESTATDDVIDLLELLIGDLLTTVNRQGEKERLRTLKDLDAAALQLCKACSVLLDPNTDDPQVREAVFARISQEKLAGAIAKVEQLARLPDDNYYEFMLSRWRHVRLFWPRLLNTIDFQGTEAGEVILEALQFLKTIEGKKKPDLSAAPLAVVTKSWAKLVIDAEGKVDRKAYTFCVLERLRALLRRRDLFVSPSQLEVNKWTGFASEFTHISEGNARVEDLSLSICAVLLAEACNISLEPLVRSDVPALTKGRLLWVQQNYIRQETLTRANALLVEAQTRIPLAQLWGGGEVASADGLRFTVPVRTLNAGPNRKYFGAGRGITYYNFTSDQFTGFHGIVIPGTLRDSLFLLDGLLEQTTCLEPREIMTDTAGYSDLVFGLFWLLGYQFSPRLADIGETRFWRLDPNADYGVLNGLARQRVTAKLIAFNWDDLLRVAGSLKLGKVSASELMGTLLGGKNPTTLSKAIAELGRIAKTLYLLAYLDDETYRRRILLQLNRGEGRHSLARAVFHGRRGEVRQRYREGQEDQLGVLGLVVNMLVLWNTRYMDAALSHLHSIGTEVNPEDVARLSPLGYKHINLLGRYQFTLAEPVQQGELRPLRDPNEPVGD